MIHDIKEGLIGLGLLVLYGVLARLGLVLVRRLLHRMAGDSRGSLGWRLAFSLELPAYLTLLLIGLDLLLGRVALLGPYSAGIQTGVKVALILILAFGVQRLVRALIQWYVREKAPKTETTWDDRLMPLIGRLASLLIYALAALAILQQLDVKITPLLASLGVASLAVALALQDTLSNLFAGLYMTADQPIRVGDYVKLESGEEGYVARIGWRSSRIRMLANNIITVPNAKLAQSVITNYNLPEPEQSVVIPCGVAYGSDLATVEQVTIEVAREVLSSVQGGVASFDPFIRYNNFGDSNIDFSIILRVQTFVDRYLVTHEFIKRLHARYLKEGIEISWPVRNVHLFRETHGENG